MSTQYQEKLKDPRWQKLRLKVMERAGFKCECCLLNDQILHVHHLVYSGEPWDAPMETLECLCEDCHSVREAFDTIAGKNLIPTRLFMAIFYLIKSGKFIPGTSELSQIQSVYNRIKRQR